jgi:riboflavin transporter FmnP
MNWIILLFYILPLTIGVLGAYLMVKSNGGTVMEFLKILPFLLIPIMNIAAVVAGIFFEMEEWIKNDDKWQDFLNKKL